MNKKRIIIISVCAVLAVAAVLVYTLVIVPNAILGELLAEAGGEYSFKKDNYQDVIVTSPEGQIKYLVNSSEVRNSELKGESVKEFLAALDAANANERSTVTSTEIVAYASPEGAE